MKTVVQKCFELLGLTLTYLALTFIVYGIPFAVLTFIIWLCSITFKFTFTWLMPFTLIVILMTVILLVDYTLRGRGK